MTEIVQYMVTHSYWGQDRPWQLQTLHAEAFPVVLVTFDKPGSTSGLPTRVLPAMRDLEVLETHRSNVSNRSNVSVGVLFLRPIRHICPCSLGHW